MRGESELVIPRAVIVKIVVGTLAVVLTVKIALPAGPGIIVFGWISTVTLLSGGEGAAFKEIDSEKSPIGWALTIKLVEPPDVIVCKPGLMENEKSFVPTFTVTITILVRTSWPAMPTMAIVKLDAGVLTVVFMVSVTLPPGLIVEEDRLAVTLLSSGETDVARMTDSEKLPTGWILTAKLRETPGLIVCEPGVIENEKSFASSFTVTVTVAVRTSWPAVPVMVMVKVEAGVLTIVFTVKVVLSPGMTTFDEKLGVMLLSGGEMIVASVTASKKLPIARILIPKLTEAPGLIACEPGVIKNSKFFVSTLTVTVSLCTSWPATPKMVMVKVDAGVLVSVSTVKVSPLPGLIVFDESFTETLLSDEERVVNRETASEKFPIGWILIAKLAEPPGAIVCEVGVIKNAKSLMSILTVNILLLVTIPKGFTTAIGPVSAPCGTFVMIWVPSAEMVKLGACTAIFFEKITVVAPVKLKPVIVRLVPTGPLVGEKLVIIGRLPPPSAVTVKIPALMTVPAIVVTLIRPVVAPMGTVAVIDVSEPTERFALVPLNSTAVAPVKLVPVIVTLVPTGPLVGKNSIIMGGLITVKILVLMTVFPGITTLIRPVVAPIGTVAVIEVSETTEKVVPVPLKSTVVAPVKPVPVIVTLVPTGPLIGEKLPIVSCTTIKVVRLVAVPTGVVTLIIPLVAPEGTVAMIDVLDKTLKLAFTPLNLTAVAPLKFVPVIVTLVPSGPLMGKKPLIAGTLLPVVTVKLLELVAVSTGVVTLIGPVVAPEGTVALIRVVEATLKVELTLLNCTAVVPLKLVPVIATLVPTGPLVGVKKEIVGELSPLATVKLAMLVAVPAWFVTLIFPVVVPSGTVVVIDVPDTTLKVALIPLNLTAVASVKFVPVIVTLVPTDPIVGVKEVMVGSWSTVKLVALVAEPPEVVTLIGPVVAPAGTVVVIDVSDTTLKTEALTPLNLTAVAPVKFVPVIVTLVPTDPIVGVKEVMVGSWSTVKLVALITPCGAARLITVIFPVAAPTGTVALIEVGEMTVGAPALVPLNWTSVTLSRFVPEIDTLVPTKPLEGEKLEIVGVFITMKSAMLVAVPSAVVTVIFPVIAVGGIVPVISVSVAEITVAIAVPNFSVGMVLPTLRLVPVIVTLSPDMPLVGVKPVIFGSTLKTATLVAVPWGVVTLIDPVVAPEGTVAVIDVLEMTLKLALTPLNLTAVAPLKFVPVIVTLVPTAPIVGVKEEIVGADCKRFKSNSGAGLLTAGCGSEFEIFNLAVEACHIAWKEKTIITTNKTKRR
jgi:hypothetical protein